MSTTDADRLLIHTMAIADDEPGMVDLTFRVPVKEVLGRSLANINSEGGMWGWSGFFDGKAREMQAARDAAKDHHSGSTP